MRISRNINGLELGLYGYKGFFKRPLGFDPLSNKGIFPELFVYGVSLRGTLSGGVINIESGYYNSIDDRDGNELFIENSILKSLIGFEKEILKNLTGSVQYFSELMQDYDVYEKTCLASGQPVLKEKNHDWITLRLTKLLRQQTLIVSFFGYYSPSEKDYYLTVILNNIESGLGNNLIFKGGTLLSKIHLSYHRLSEDLDFTFVSPLGLNTRAERSRAIRPIRKKMSGFLASLDLKSENPEGEGFNNSTQYVFNVLYPSFITGIVKNISDIFV